MFKIPQWENDVPQATKTFEKRIKRKKESTIQENVYKSDPVDNKIKSNTILNRSYGSTSRIVKDINRNTKPILTVNGNSYSNGSNMKVNGLTKEISNKISKGKNIEQIMEIKKYIGPKEDELENDKVTRNVVKTKLKIKGRNSLLNIHNDAMDFKTSIQNHNSVVKNNPKEPKKYIDNQINLAVIGKNKKGKEINPNQNLKNKKTKERNTDNSLEGQNLNSDLLDEVLINAKKRKLSEAFKKDDREDVLFAETNHRVPFINNNKTKITNKNEVKTNSIINDNKTVKTKPVYNKKKEIMKTILEIQNHRKSINISGKNLRNRMLDRLKAAQFRYLNEKLYTSSGQDAQKLFENDPMAFQTYHKGYQQQVKKWPVNPLDVIVKRIQKMPKSSQIADLGCGEAALSKRIAHNVRSFDLVATAPGVEVCDMAHTPLLTGSMDVTVFCLALMGTDLTQYIIEANRVLKIGGHLLIAEVESRFDQVDDFTKEVERLGFKLQKLDKNNNVFFFMEFTKIKDPPKKKSKQPQLTLKPCMYKKR